MGYALESGVTDAAGRSLVTLAGVVSTNNSTSANLAGDAVFTGTADDVLNYGAIIISLHPNQDSAVDGLEIQFSPDNSHWDSTDVFSIFADESKTFTFQPVMRYFRIKYTNGSTPQTEFHLQTQFRASYIKPSSHRVEESISSEDDAELVKSVLTGQTPFGDYDTVKMDSSGALNVAFGDSANLDAFSRLRVSTPDTVFDSGFQYDLQPLVYEQVTANSGTIAHLPNDASALMSTAAAGGSSAILQSKNYHRYIPAKGQLVVMTGNFRAAVSGVTKRIGYFDANDGVYYEQAGDGTLSLNLRSSTSGSPVNTSVVQTDWNLDPLDGTGRSGLIIDATKVYIFTIELQWLGMGRVRCSFDIDGRIYPVHEFDNANNLTTVYMKTANLPVRWEIAGNGVATMQATCASVQSEGGADKFLSYQFAYNRAVVTAGNGTPAYAFSVRPKATFNSITNRSQLRPISFDCLVTGNYPVRLDVYYGTTVATPTWGDMDATYSAMQVDTAGTPSGGVKVMSFWASSTTAASAGKAAVEKNFLARYPLTLDVAGTGYNNMTVYVTAIGGTSTCYPGMIWEEVR